MLSKAGPKMKKLGTRASGASGLRNSGSQISKKETKNSHNTDNESDKVADQISFTK